MVESLALVLFSFIKRNKELEHDREIYIYGLDVTFDMTITDKLNRYDYFNLCDEDIKKDHCIISNVPKCITKGSDYFSINSLLANNIAELAKIISDNLRNGKKSFLVKFADVEDTNGILDEVMNIAQQQFQKNHRSGITTINHNLSQCVFEINYT